MTKNSPGKKKLSDGIRKKDEEEKVAVPRGGGLAKAFSAAPTATASPTQEPRAREGIVIIDGVGEEHASSEARSSEEVVADVTPRRSFFARGRNRVAGIGARADAETTRRVRSGASGAGAHPALWGACAGCAALLGAIIFVSTAGARLTITLKPRTESVSLEDITARFDTNAAKVAVTDKVIPAERLVFARTLRKEFNASATEDVHSRAHGTIKIYNQFSSVPQVLVRNTRFVTQTGAVFRLSAQVTVPGAKMIGGKITPQFIEAEVVAGQAGEAANGTDETKLRIPGFAGTPKYDGFYAIADQGFSGGASGTMRVASADDITHAEEVVTKELVALLEQEMASKVPPGLVYQTALHEVQITQVVAPPAHTPGEKFSVEAVATGKVLAFRASDVDALIRGVVVGDDRTHAIVAGSETPEYGVRTIDFELGRADVVIGGSVKTKSVIPEDELASLVTRKGSGSINDLLKSRPEVGSFTLSFFPPWRASAPDDPAKIHFVVQ